MFSFFNFFPILILIQFLKQVASDTLTTNICIQFCCQFELLKKQLRDLTKIDGKFSSNSFSENCKNTEVNNEIIDELSKIIKKHTTLLKMSRELNDIIGWTVFFQFGSSVLIVCVLLYELSVVSIKFLENYWKYC